MIHFNLRAQNLLKVAWAVCLKLEITVESKANIKLSRPPGAGKTGFGLRNEWGDEGDCKDMSL